MLSHAARDSDVHYDHFQVALTSGALIEGFATFSAEGVQSFTNDWYPGSRMETVINCVFAGFLTALGKNSRCVNSP